MKYSEAKQEANAFTERTGMIAHIVRFGHGYDWVSEHYFKTYPKKKIYYTTKITDEEMLKTLQMAEEIKKKKDVFQYSDAKLTNILQKIGFRFRPKNRKSRK